VGSNPTPRTPIELSSLNGEMVDQSFDTQWALDQINVDAITHGFFLSEMTEAAFQDEKAPRHILSRTPLGRRGEL